MSIDPWCWNLTRLRAGRGCLVCHSVMACQTVMPLPWEFIVLCAGTYWAQITQGHAGSTKVCPLPCSDKEFISVCHAEPIVQAELLGVSKCRHILSFASTSSLPQGNQQDSPPPPPYVIWPRWNIPCIANWAIIVSLSIWMRHTRQGSKEKDCFHHLVLLP